MTAEAWDRFRESVGAEDWSAALSSALEALSTLPDELRLTQLLDELQDAQVVVLFCRSAVTTPDGEGGLRKLQESLSDTRDLAKRLHEFNRAPQLPRLRLCVSCALAATYARRNLAEETAAALWEAAWSVAPGPAPSAELDAGSDDARALLDGTGGVDLVKRVCRAMHEQLGEQHGWVAAQLFHLTREFMLASSDPADLLRLTGLLVGDRGDRDQRGRMCWVECEDLADGFGEVFPDATGTPPLRDECLDGINTARDYLRSLRDTNNGDLLWKQDTDLRLAFGPKYADDTIGQVDGRSMTALIAALGENLLRKGPPVDLSCSVSADLVPADGTWKLASVEGIREKVFAACEAGLRSLIVCPEDAGAAETAASDAYAQRVAACKQSGAAPPQGPLHITPCRTVEEVRSALTREPQALLDYLDDTIQKMVQSIPTIFVPAEWREFFFEKLYQPLQVGVMVLKRIPQPPGPNGEELPPREEWVEERRLWDEYHRDLVAAQTRRFVILADGGHGKSTLLQFTTWKLATEAARAIRAHEAGIREVEIPFFFRCDGLEGEEPLEQAMLTSLEENYPSVKQHMGLMEDILTADRAVICWDALDETTDRWALAKKIEQFASNHPDPEIHLTCRTKQLPQINWPVQGGHDEIKLALLDTETIKRFCLAWANTLNERGI